MIGPEATAWVLGLISLFVLLSVLDLGADFLWRVVRGDRDDAAPDER